jgi:uncharacterized protein
MSTEKIKKRLGFAILKERNPGRLATIASEGGKSAHKAGTAHEFTSEEAKAAGRKGGLASQASRKKLREIVAETEQEPLAMPAPSEGVE